MVCSRQKISKMGIVRPVAELWRVKTKIRPFVQSSFHILDEVPEWFKSEVQKLICTRGDKLDVGSVSTVYIGYFLLRLQIQS